ncbi:TonB-dependent receptor domain-containing protein [Halopseudomonas salegens]|uniref:Outer membrane receptor for ferrienterochelin and colicins n=1 Tax=Halopseudomonas salegens TaxID=1434072 RepID=A0A1H2F5P1_9GAMM|nr:TonB-dependent receptor [Halopseudomonas salegens]SDU02615.1 outer membrane receptor for ferrienterochelin and colicins [Halopseudomonas salegens]
MGPSLSCRLSGLGLFSLSLLAVQVATAQEQVRLADTVITASGFEQKITEAPASITVIGNEQLRQNSYANLAQALDGVEGLDIRQGTGKTGGLNISIRGLPSQYTLILIDGRRQNSAGNVTPNGFNEISTSFIPPMSAIERIEVIRGPMSTLYGSDAMGGVVNIITKKISNEWGASVTLDHTLQENTDYGNASRTNVYASGPLIADRLGLSLRGSLYDRDASDLSFSDGSTVSRRGAAPVEGRVYSLGTALNLRINDQHDLGLELDRSVQNYNNDDCQLGNLDGKSGGNAASGCSTDAPLRANGYQDELRFERTQVAVTHDAALTIGRWSNSISRNVTETMGRTIPGNPIGDSYTGFPAIVIGADRTLKSTDLIADSKLVMPLGDNHITTVGGQWWDAKVSDGIASEQFEQTSWALFAENEWRMRPDLALTLGGRYERHDAFGGHISPRAYLVWNTTDQWTLKGGVSRGYKTPSLNDLHGGISGITGQGSTLTIGTPGLDPEITTNTEFGVYFDNLSDFSANITLFYNQFKDKIDGGTALPNCFAASNPNQPGCISFGSGFTQDSFAQSTNIGRAMTRGIELGSRWDVAPAWSLHTHYTWSDSEQRSGSNKGAPLTNTPEHLLFARLNWAATPTLNLWLRGEYRSERERFTDRYENLNGNNQALLDAAGNLKAYEVFHLGANYRASDNLSLSAVVYNLMDKDFTKGTDYLDAAGNDSWTSDYIQSGRSTDGTLEEGRRLWLSATYEF